jgi:hypothetical protein
VTIYKQRADRPYFKPRRTVSTDSSGAWHADFISQKTAEYSVKVEDQDMCTNGTYSQPIEVKVRAKVGMFHLAKKCKGSYIVQGHVWPRKPGTQVILRRANGKHLIDSDVLDENSLYNLHVPDCDGDYRVVWRRQDQLNIKGWRDFGY